MYRTTFSLVDVEIAICQRQEIVKFYINDILKAEWKPRKDNYDGCGGSQREAGL